jgi:hypothetical protein
MKFSAWTPLITIKSGEPEDPDNVSKSAKFEFTAPCSLLQVLKIWEHTTLRQTAERRQSYPAQGTGKLVQRERSHMAWCGSTLDEPYDKKCTFCLPEAVVPSLTN